MNREQILFVAQVTEEVRAANIRDGYDHPLPSTVIADACEGLFKTARALQRLNEAACNYGLSPRQEKRREKLDDDVRDYCDILSQDSPHPLRFTGNHASGEPRGYAVIIRPPSGRTTDWGGRGFGVPA